MYTHPAPPYSESAHGDGLLPPYADAVPAKSIVRRAEHEPHPAHRHHPHPPQTFDELLSTTDARSSLQPGLRRPLGELRRTSGGALVPPAAKRPIVIPRK